MLASNSTEPYTLSDAKPAHRIRNVNLQIESASSMHLTNVFLWIDLPMFFFLFFIYISWNFKNVILDGCLCWSCKSLLCCLLALSSTPPANISLFLLYHFVMKMQYVDIRFSFSQDTNNVSTAYLIGWYKKNLSLFSFFLKLRFVMVGISTSCLPHFASWSPN